MSEIIKITIKNFQSHEYTEIVPAPTGQLTCAIGPSDSGKTATQRATRWLLYNLPQGDDFIRVGANSVHVRIDYASGHSVIRSRSHKGFNRYEIIYPDREPEKFEGFGSSVPLEVQQITGVRPIEIGDMTININLASQLEGPFLGSSISAPARAKVLGKLAGTEEVDYAAKSAGTDLYRRRQDKERHQNDETRLTKNIEQYAYLEELETKIQVAETLLTSIKEKSERLAQLKRLGDQLMQVMENQEKTIYRIAYLNGIIDVAEPLLFEAAQKLARYQRLQALGVEWETTIEQLSIEQIVLDRTQKIQEANTLWDTTKRNYDRFWNLAGLCLNQRKIGSQIAIENYTLRKTTSIGEAELLLSCATKHNARYTALHKLQSSRDTIEPLLIKYRALLKSTESIDAAVIHAEQLHDRITRLGKLQNISGRYEDTVREFMLQDMRISRLVGVDEAGEILDGVREKMTKHGRLTLLGVGYKANVLKITVAQKEADQAALDEQRMVAEYKDTLIAAGVCPVCGSQITKEILEEAI